MDGVMHSSRWSSKSWYVHVKLGFSPSSSPGYPHRRPFLKHTYALGDILFLVDYKTGSNRYPDPKQLKLMALMTFAHFPEVNKVKAGLLFVMHESFMDEEYTRDQIPKLWSYFENDLERLSLSYENDTWQANPTPLCGWCPVRTCEFHKER